MGSSQELQQAGTSSGKAGAVCDVNLIVQKHAEPDVLAIVGPESAVPAVSKTKLDWEDREVTEPVKRLKLKNTDQL
jgi:hypothetical protein